VTMPCPMLLSNASWGVTLTDWMLGTCPSFVSGPGSHPSYLSTAPHAVAQVYQSG
jgi:hypothetical protein